VALMRKTLAISLLGAVLAAPLSAQAPNPCEVYGRAVIGDRAEYLLVSPFGNAKDDVTFGPVHAPPLAQTVGKWFATAFGLVEVPARFQDRPNLNHTTIPATDGIEFALSYEGTLNCGYFDIFRIRAGKIEFLFDEEGHSIDGCGGPIARPVLVAGTPYIVEASFVDGDRFSVRYPTRFEFFALARREKSMAGESALVSVCKLTFKHDVVTSVKALHPGDWLDLRAHDAAIARLHEKRFALLNILDYPSIDLAHVLGPDARRIDSARGTKAARFRAGDSAYRLTARRQAEDLTVFRLRPLAGGRFFDLFVGTRYPIIGYTVE
jgi:hypothetical protein